MNDRKYPRITLIGAGPGDPDLLTIKGLKKLAEADVVLYDALVNTELLKMAPAKSIKILVGKRAGFKKFSQEEINIMMISLARQYGHVVRLKGGDPNIFGRGFEEYSSAVSAKIPVVIIPGISSSTGLPSLHEVPLTHRGISEGFWVMTGTTRTGKLSEDIRLGARSSSTLVILMGMRKLSEIVRVFKAENKTTLPVMIIQNGSLVNEKKVIGTIDTIEDIVKKEGVYSPAIIIIGEVIDHAIPFIQINARLNEVVTEYPEQRELRNPKGSFSNIKIAG